MSSKNVFRCDSEYHNDGFQSWQRRAADGTSDLMLEKQHDYRVGELDPANPLRGSLQGIGMFDGRYDNVVIRNNVVR